MSVRSSTPRFRPAFSLALLALAACPNGVELPLSKHGANASARAESAPAQERVAQGESAAQRERAQRESAQRESAQRESAAQRADCPTVTATRSTGRLEHGDLDELSGLVASRRQPGVLWVHNDSGDHARIFAIDPRGRLLATVKLEAARAEDYEDIAIAPGPADAADYLYIADTGDNLLRRRSVQVYRIDEPALGAAPRGAKRKLATRMLEVSYEDGPHDVETLLVDPRSGDLFFVEKGPLLARREPVGVYRVSAEEAEHSPATARRVATVELGPSTAGDVLPDGSGLAIRNYSQALFWPREPGESVAQALSRAGCELPLADRGEQGESFGFAADGASFFTIAEGASAPVHESVFQ